MNLISNTIYRSNDVKMITLDDVDQCWNFKGHKKAISSFSFDPEGQFLVSQSLFTDSWDRHSL